MFLEGVGYVSLNEREVLRPSSSDGQEHQQQLLVVTGFNWHVPEGEKGVSCLGDLEVVLWSRETSTRKGETGELDRGREKRRGKEDGKRKKGRREKGRGEKGRGGRRKEGRKKA